MISSHPPTRSKARSCAVAILTSVLLGLAAVSFAEPPVTGHANNQRTGANIEEGFLTPGNVNSTNFGRLFNYPIDYQALAQPLYVPNVDIPGMGTHNVVYVGTMADSVYAFDADSNEGPNAAPLWHVNFTDPDNGITTASAATGTLPCAKTENGGPGFVQEGIVSTPAIDSSTGTMYLVAKTLELGVVRHRLHALDIATGAEKFGGPVLITATSISNKGHQMTFNSLHQKNRPGLLLSNGVVYIAFGSNYCNDHNSGWVLSYDPASLQQLGSFNTSPDTGYASIWQTGNGIAADDQGNIYASTAESSNYDVPNGGQSFSNSILKFSASDVALADYFTPWNVAYLNQHDLDVSSIGPVVLPDQDDSPYPHELLASGKQGVVYVLNRDNMGMFGASDSQIIQEFSLQIVGENMASPAFWNQTAYFTPGGTHVQSFSLSGGLLSPFAQSPQNYGGAHSASISANGNTNGVLWLLSGGTPKGAQLYALDAVSLNQLYTSQQNATRDKLSPISHFATQSVVNGRVYIATRSALEVYGLFDFLNLISGGNQTGQVMTALPNPITFQAFSPYSGEPVIGANVSFSDGNKGGTFDPPAAVTDGSGFVSTTYTLPKLVGTYTITASGTDLANASVQETAVPGPAVRFSFPSGNNQTGIVGTVLPNPIVVKAVDKYFNAVPGVVVTFDDQNKGGSFDPVSGVTDSKGSVATMYQLPTTPGVYKPRANSPGLPSLKATATAIAQ
jgi:hypothetical protein